MDSDIYTSASFPETYPDMKNGEHVPLQNKLQDISGSVFFELTDLLVCLSDVSGTIVKAGAGFAALLGCGADGLDGLNFDKLLTKKSYQKLLNSLHSPNGGKENIKAYDARAEKIYLTYTLSKVEDLCLIRFQDRTKQRKLVKKHKRQEKMLIQQSKMAAIGEMLGVIAHQWKQPLNTLSIIAQTIGDDFDHGGLDEKAVEGHMESISEQIRFMNATVDDFRQFFIPQKEPLNFSIREAILKILTILDPQLKAFNVTASLKGDGEDMLVAGYRNEFMQVALNILSNSKDAILERRKTDPSFETARGLAEITIAKHGTHCIITIKDNGGGIKPNALKKLFSPYFTTKNEQGTGIGLYLSRTIIEDKMHGQIQGATEGEHAVFTIRLPLAN